MVSRSTQKVKNTHIQKTQPKKTNRKSASKDMSKEAKKYNARIQKIFAVEMKGKSGKKIATYT